MSISGVVWAPFCKVLSLSTRGCRISLGQAVREVIEGKLSAKPGASYQPSWAGSGYRGLYAESGVLGVCVGCANLITLLGFWK